MEKDLTIVWIMTIGLGLAGLLGFTARKLRLPTILGYLVAGYIIGPYSPGFVADPGITDQLAEIGVILMLFGVGLHFKLKDLIDVKYIAIPGATFQTLVAALSTTALLYYFGWAIESGVIMGLSIGVASTVVLVRVLADHHLLNTQEGHIAVGWLVVEDIFTVIILVLIPTFVTFTGGAQFSMMPVFGAILYVLTKFAVLVLIMFTLGHKCVEYVLTSVARLRSQELFILAVLGLMFLIASISAFLFGTSIALGAFIAGMVIGKTSVRHQAAANALPLKDIFAVIFFLTVGMLFNPIAIRDHFLLFVGISFVILVLKPLSAYVITVFSGYSRKIALTVAFSLAQIGEFSFILSEEAMNYKLLPEVGFDILVACAFVSISINPLLFLIIDYLDAQLSRWSRSKSHAPIKKMSTVVNSPLHKVIVVGLGPIGTRSAAIVQSKGMLPVIIESNIDTVSDLEDDYEILFGDAAEATILEEAKIKEVHYLIITIPDTEKTLAIIETARNLNPGIKVIARVRYLSEVAFMEDLRVKYICTEGEALKGFDNLVIKSLNYTETKSTP
jgi:CPA2 family monovalent cation:H+ antiporter-2